MMWLFYFKCYPQNIMVTSISGPAFHKFVWFTEHKITLKVTSTVAGRVKNNAQAGDFTGWFIHWM